MLSNFHIQIEKPTDSKPVVRNAISHNPYAISIAFSQLPCYGSNDPNNTSNNHAIPYLKKSEHSRSDLPAYVSAKNVQSDDGAQGRHEKEEQKRAENDQDPTDALCGAETTQQRRADSDDGDGDAA